MASKITIVTAARAPQFIHHSRHANLVQSDLRLRHPRMVSRDQVVLLIHLHAVARKVEQCHITPAHVVQKLHQR